MSKFVNLLPLVGCFVVSAAFAAVSATDLPSGVDPARMDNQLKDASDAEKKADPNMPQSENGASQKQLSEVKFTIGKVELVGAKTDVAYFNKKAQEYTAPFLNKQITLLDIQKIAFKLQNEYRNKGFMLTQVVLPPQKIEKEKGTIQLQVYEGFVAQVLMTKGKETYWDHVEQLQKGIVQSVPLKSADLERYVLLTNDIPGMNVQSFLQPSKTSGAADLVVKVEKSKNNGYLSYNNRGTNFVGPRQLQGGISINSIYGADRLSINGATVMPRPQELRYINIDYRNYFGPEGMQFHMETTQTKSMPGSTISSLDLRGFSRRYQFDITYPVIRSRKENLLVMAGFYALNSENDQRNPSPATKIYDDRIRAITAEITYDNSDKFQGSNRVKAVIKEGLDMFGANKDTDTRPKSRLAARSKFVSVGLTASRIQYIVPGLSLMGAATSQYGMSGLYSSEQFGFGGASFGAAYDNSELTGDRGIGAKIELRYEMMPDVMAIQWAQFYVGQDVGKVWNLDTANQLNGVSASSRSVGVRYKLTPYLEGSFDAAQPLSRIPAQTLSDRVRFFFNITGRV